MASTSTSADVLHIVSLSFKDGVDFETHLKTDVSFDIVGRLARMELVTRCKQEITKSPKVCVIYPCFALAAAFEGANARPG